MSPAREVVQNCDTDKSPSKNTLDPNVSGLRIVFFRSFSFMFSDLHVNLERGLNGVVRVWQNTVHANCEKKSLESETVNITVPYSQEGEDVGSSVVAFAASDSGVRKGDVSI